MNDLRATATLYQATSARALRDAGVELSEHVGEGHRLRLACVVVAPADERVDVVGMSYGVEIERADGHWELIGAQLHGAEELANQERIRILLDLTTGQEERLIARARQADRALVAASAEPKGVLH
jgi:hypothetical protein